VGRRIKEYIEAVRTAERLNKLLDEVDLDEIEKEAGTLDESLSSEVLLINTSVLIDHFKKRRIYRSGEMLYQQSLSWSF